MNIDEAQLRGLMGPVMTFAWPKRLHGKALRTLCGMLLTDMLANGSDKVGMIAAPDPNTADNIWIYYKQFVLDETEGRMRVVDVPREEMADKVYEMLQKAHFHVVRLEMVKKGEITP